MTDDGFDFGPPPPRREARQFEPPPWEREQFDKMAREREEQRRAEERAARAAAEAAAAAPTPSAPAAQASAAPPAPETGPVVGSAGELAGEQTLGAAPAPKAELDSAQVDMMMMELRADEPPTLESAWLVALVAGCVLCVIGLAVTIWGSVAFARPDLGQAGVMGAVVMVVFGLAFAGVGGWVIFKALRQRGVL